MRRGRRCGRRSRPCTRRPGALVGGDRDEVDGCRGRHFRGPPRGRGQRRIVAFEDEPGSTLCCALRAARANDDELVADACRGSPDRSRSGGGMQVEVQVNRDVRPEGDYAERREVPGVHRTLRADDAVFAGSDRGRGDEFAGRPGSGKNTRTSSDRPPLAKSPKSGPVTRTRRIAGATCSTPMTRARRAVNRLSPPARKNGDAGFGARAAGPRATLLSATRCGGAAAVEATGVVASVMALSFAPRSRKRPIKANHAPVGRGPGNDARSVKLNVRCERSSAKVSAASTCGSMASTRQRRLTLTARGL